MKKKLLAASMVSLFGASVASAGGLLAPHVQSAATAVHQINAVPAISQLPRLGTVPALAVLGRLPALPGLDSVKVPGGASPSGDCTVAILCTLDIPRAPSLPPLDIPPPWLLFDVQIWPGLVLTWTSTEVVAPLVANATDLGTYAAFRGIAIGGCAANPDCGGGGLPMESVNGFLADVGNKTIGLVPRPPPPPHIRILNREYGL